MNNSNIKQSNSFSSSKDGGFQNELSILEKIYLWWSRFNLRSKLLAFGTLVVDFINFS